jgi:hypothetical protein
MNTSILASKIGALEMGPERRKRGSSKKAIRNQSSRQRGFYIRTTRIRVQLGKKIWS